jgi:alpha-galactosidase
MTTNPRSLNVAYIGGGSRGWAWGFMTDLALDPDMCGVIRLYDIDHEAARRNEKIGNAIHARPDAVSHWKFQYAPTLREALEGADFVVISILPGTFEEMASDVHAPERLGIYQPVGDSVGAGGFMRAMRTVPMYVEIAKAVRDYAPGAWIINYTNPMNLCVRTIYEVFPEAKAIGCCHEVFGTQWLLQTVLKEFRGIEGTQRDEIHVDVNGINHFTWIMKASYKGIDLMPLYAEFAEKYAATGYREGHDDNWMNNVFACNHRVKIDLFRRYGAIAAAGDRHLAEFVAPAYTRDPESIRSWGFALTPVSWRTSELEKRLARSERLYSGEEQVTLKPTGEEGHCIIKALLGLGRLVTNVNFPNRGQAPDLPLGAIVETNALFDLDRVEPVSASPLPDGVRPLVLRHLMNYENTLRAALACDRKLGFSTFMNDPQLGGVSLEDGLALFNDMIEAQRGYLPERWFRS